VLDRGEPAFQSKHAVASPEIVQDKKRGDADADIHAQLERVALALTLLGDFFVKKIKLERHDSLATQVFEGGAAGHVKGSEFLLERRTLGCRQSDLAILERIPNFAGQSQLIA